MPRNNYFRIIKCWLEITTSIQHRKYYSSSELFQIFNNDLKTKYNLKLRTFITTLNKIEDCIDRFKKVNINDRKFRHIILNTGDKTSFENTIRIRQRNRNVPILNPIRSLAFPNRVAVSTSTTPKQTQHIKNSDNALNDKEDDTVVVI